jgi:hypothetical protein
MNIKRNPDKLSDYDSACANVGRLSWMSYFSFYLKEETGPGSENLFSQKAGKMNNIKEKLITFGMSCPRLK